MTEYNYGTFTIARWLESHPGTFLSDPDKESYYGNWYVVEHHIDPIGSSLGYAVITVEGDKPGWLLLETG